MWICIIVGYSFEETPQEADIDIMPTFTEKDMAPIYCCFWVTCQLWQSGGSLVEIIVIHMKTLPIASQFDLHCHQAETLYSWNSLLLLNKMLAWWVQVSMHGGRSDIFGISGLACHSRQYTVRYQWDLGYHCSTESGFLQFGMVPW